jgi:hypothetical protein
MHTAPVQPVHQQNANKITEKAVKAAAGKALLSYMTPSSCCYFPAAVFFSKTLQNLKQ